MATRIAINGFGRIGRCVLRALYKRGLTDIELVAINDLTDRCKCTWVQDVDHALKVIPYLQPDGILVDYNMPKMNGLECIEKIKVLPDSPFQHIVLYSTTINNDMKKRAKELGVCMCINKPNTIDKLKEKLAYLIDFISSNEIEKMRK